MTCPGCAWPWIHYRGEGADDMEKWITGQEILDQWPVHPQELALICWSYKASVYHPVTLDLIDIEGLAESWLYRTAQHSGESSTVTDTFDLFCLEASKCIVPSLDPLSEDERKQMLFDLPTYLFSREQIAGIEQSITHNGGFGQPIKLYQAIALGHRWPSFPPETPEEFVAKCRAQGTKDDYELARFVDNLFFGDRRLSDLEMGQLLPADPGRTDISTGSQRDRGKRLRRKKK
jgi:hypothetical protein